MLVCVCLCVYFRRILLLWTSVVSDCATQWTVASQAPLSMGFSWQEYWNGLPCPSPRYLPNPGIKPTSSAAPALQADSLPLSHWGRPYMTALIILNIITSMNPPRKVRMCVIACIYTKSFYLCIYHLSKCFKHKI